MENQTTDNQNNEYEYKSVDGEIWGTREETEQANQAWYDAMLNGEKLPEEEKPKTRR